MCAPVTAAIIVANLFKYVRRELACIEFFIWTFPSRALDTSPRWICAIYGGKSGAWNMFTICGIPNGRYCSSKTCTGDRAAFSNTWDDRWSAVQMGTQMRSIPHYATAVDYVKSGKLGKICEI